MNKKVIAGIIIVIVVVAAVLIFAHGSKSPSYSTNTPSNSSNNSSAALSSTSMNPSFTINANDDSADHETVSVMKGANVSLTFAVDTNGVYHGGLEFKSTDPEIDSGGITPGSSKTVTFTADHSFSFQPYWFQSGVKKNYLITVNVK